MTIKFGNLKQIIISIVLLGIVGMATISSHVANVHLVFTIFLGVLHAYLSYQISEGKVRPKNDAPMAYAYLFTFGVNSIISFAFSWWFSGIVWAFILCIYISANQKRNKKETIKPKKGEAV